MPETSNEAERSNQKQEHGGSSTEAREDESRMGPGRSKSPRFIVGGADSRPPASNPWRSDIIDDAILDVPNDLPS
jgi:hypothetical protein